MEMNLPALKMVLANEAFPKGCPGQTLSASEIDQDIVRRVAKALGRKPLRQIKFMCPKPYSKIHSECQRR